MGKRVVVIASGETERRALPLLLRDLAGDGLELLAVLIPPRNQDITPGIAERLMKAAYYSTAPVPDKFVILKDTDGKSSTDVLAPFDGIERRLGFSVSVLCPPFLGVLEFWLARAEQH